MVAAPDPCELLRSRSHLALLVIGALVGIPVAAVAYFHPALVNKVQDLVFVRLAKAWGFDSAPIWWPVLPLLLGGLVVGATDPLDLPGIFLASLATLCLGAVQALARTNSAADARRTPRQSDRASRLCPTGAQVPT